MVKMTDYEGMVPENLCTIDRFGGADDFQGCGLCFEGHGDEVADCENCVVNKIFQEYAEMTGQTKSAKDTACKVRGIFCLNSKCRHYFEDNCMKMFEENTVNISEEGKCLDFEKGEHIGYADNELAQQGHQEVMRPAT